MRTAVKNTHTEADFQRKLFQDDDSNHELLWEFSTAEYESKSGKEEGEMALDGRNRSRDDFFLKSISRTTWTDGVFAGNLELS